MIDPFWRRIAGLQVEDDGTIGVVWIAHDTISDVTHCYDACLFRREVFAVVVNGVTARGRWIPVAWPKEAEPFAKKLLEQGVNTLHDPCEPGQAVSEVISREIWQRMRTGRFRVEKSLGEWLTEFNTFKRDDSRVPEAGFPLMTATRHAISQLAYARPEHMPGSKRPNHPNRKVI